MFTNDCIIIQVGNLGYTALHYAARGGHPTILQHLVAANADLNALTTSKETALHLVCFDNNII